MYIVKIINIETLEWLRFGVKDEDELLKIVELVHEYKYAYAIHEVKHIGIMNYGGDGVKAAKEMLEGGQKDDICKDCRTIEAAEEAARGGRGEEEEDEDEDD